MELLSIETPHVGITGVASSGAAQTWHSSGFRQDLMDEVLSNIPNGRENLYPEKLEQQYPQVLSRIIELWSSPEIDDHFMDLLVDERGGRQGFPPEVASELFALSQVHAKLRSQKQQFTAIANPWVDIEDSKRVAIVQQGYDFSPNGFMRSVENGDRNAVTLFLSGGVDVDTRDERGWTPLMVSSFNGKEEIALLLIRSGADIHAMDKRGYGPLHWAAFNGYRNVVKMLIDKRADANARSNHGWTPLLQAATRGHLIAAGQLIAGGANINLASNDGWTPLHKAAANGHTEMVKLLLVKGANRNAKYLNGAAPLALAMKNKHDKVVALLTESRQDVWRDSVFAGGCSF